MLITDQLGELIEWLLPASPGLRVHQLIATSDELTLLMASTHSEACCPLCGQSSARVHSHYTRTLQDLPWAAFQVRLRVQVHRFFCENPTCPRKIFTEPLTALAERYARRTNQLREELLTLGWALGGQAGARQCVAHGMPITGTTLLSLLRRYGAVTSPTPRVLGVDDWSLQAHSAGTLLVDLERHQPIEVLAGCDEQVLADWLLAHPGVDVISRDRGASYLRGATKGAPQAQQVLDRWHVLKNLGEVLQKILGQQADVLHQAADEAAPATFCQPLSAASSLPAQSRSTSDEGMEQEKKHPPAVIVPPTPAPRARKPPRRKPATLSKQRQWQLETYQKVHELAVGDWTRVAIARQLHIGTHTVGKYLRMEHFVDQRHHPGGSSVEPYRAYLEQRWQEGCRMIKTLWEELKVQGFTGSYQSVWLFTRQWPASQAIASADSPPVAARQTPRTPWQAKWLLLRAPDKLSTRDSNYCQALYRLRPALAEAASLARQFVAMVRERKSEQLDSWLEQASASPLQELHRFALGLRAEYGAMRAALSEPWSTGQVEGQITRLKYLKRQMYGRAHIDLLRLRVLHVA